MTNRRKQLKSQALAGHVVNIPFRFSRGRFQVASGAALDIKDLALAVDNNPRGGITFQQGFFSQLTDVDFQGFGSLVIIISDYGRRRREIDHRMGIRRR